MGFFSNLTSFFERQKFKKFDQRQTEGLLDVLVFAMVADGHAADSERKELARAAELLEWEGSDTPHDYITRAEQRLRDSPNPPSFLERAAEAIDEEWMREEVYFLAALVANADRNIVKAETEFLQHLTTAFEIPRERLRLLTQRLIQEEGV